MLGVATSVAWYAKSRRQTAEDAAAAKVLSKGGIIGSNSKGVVTEIVFAGQRGDVDLAARIADADVEVLLAFPELQKLDLTGRPITDAAVPTLSRLTRLRVLNIVGTDITEDGFARLRTAIPDCNVER